MKIYLASGLQRSPNVGHWEVDTLRELAATHGCGNHELVDSPAAADVILVVDVFFDHHFRQVLAHPLVRAHRNRCYVYCEKAIVGRALPGLFTSMPRRPWDWGRYRAAWYTIHDHTNANRFIEEARANDDRPLFYSFLGRDSHPVRRRLLRLDHSRADAVVEDTGAAYDHWNHDQPDREAAQRRYAEITARSRFVLCPRGWSPNSIRLYETMQLGRVPVILADAWRRPLGPLWEEFAIFVPERDVARLPEILAPYEPRHREMGAAARAAWERFFCPQRALGTLFDALEDMHRNRRVDERLLGPLRAASMLVTALHHAGYVFGNRLRRWTSRHS